MYRRSELFSITSSDTPIDFFYFISLLIFFDEYKDDMCLEDLKIIVDNVEECRLYLNQDNTDPMTRESINPNVYEYYRLQEIKHKNNNKEIEYIKTNYTVPV